MMTTPRTCKILVVWLLCAGQNAFGQAAEPEPGTRLVFRGEPMVLPLECREEHLLRAGLVCNDVTPCALTMELVAAGSLGNRIFVMGNVHSSAGTVSSVLLASSDGGATWVEPIDRISGAGLEIFRSVGSEHGWIAGQQWEADSSPIPFLLASRNGGERWSRQNIWEHDDRNGMIFEFDFQTETHGYLVIERTNTDVDPFELYETRTGGSSWGIREMSNEEPEIPFESAETPDRLRLRGDASTGAYWVEERRGDKWEPLAAFAPHVGTCNNMEREGEKPPHF